MKTIEEKAKAYDEAMKQAIEIYGASNEDGKLALEMIFPELAESEDERIRQEMIDFLQETIDNVGESPNIWTMANAKKWLAWLEKQGEQKTVEWSEEDKTMAFTLMRDIEQASFISKEGKNERIKWLNNLTDRCLPQSKQEWSEEDEQMICSIIFFLAGFMGNDDKIGWLNALKDRVVPQKKQGWSKEQKPKWSEWEEEMFNYVYNEYKDRQIYSHSSENERDINGEILGWLKSLRPQKQQEWNKQDIEMIDWLIRCCEKEHEELCNDRYGHQDIVSDLKRDCRKKWDWLDNLKNRIAPQKQWKPSEEQMEALKEASDKDWDVDGNSPLYRLYEQLKEL